MWNLPKPDLNDAIADIDNVIAHTNTLNNTDKPSIEKIYRQYDSNGGYVPDADHDAMQQKHRKALKGAYPKTFNGGHLQYIRDELMANVDKCPMCAIGRPSTLDHYMPESRYDGVAACRLNLVPMCRDCNSDKNADRYADYLHAYYDTLPNDRILVATPAINANGGVSFTFSVDTAVLTDASLAHKLAGTISGMHLEDTFNKELNTFLIDKLAFRNFKNDRHLEEYIKDELHRSDRIYGLGSWRSAVLKAIADNPNLRLNALKNYL